MEIRFLFVSLVMVVFEFTTSDALKVGEDNVCVRIFTRREPVMCGKIPCRPKTFRVKKIQRTLCCSGYHYSNEEKKCMMDCSGGCLRGTCKEYGVCVCEPPLVLKSNGACDEPRCEPECVNGRCVDDGTCACDAGFVQHNTTHCAPSCTDGFKNDPQTLQCTPDCGDSCSNGHCTAPNTCLCNEGYERKNNTCAPVCNTCVNGSCIAPDICKCNVGYIASSNKSICTPDCGNKCINASCGEPGKCACFEGYESVDDWTCKPKCGRCDHGECVAPDQCRCSEGYVLSEGICKPHCSEECVNGICAAPNTCRCNDGYELNGTFRCRPVCGECVNASCTSPGTCTCVPGHERLNETVCVPTCRSCENGVCVSPGKCQCVERYKWANETCTPECTTECINSYCTAPEVCACKDGYIKNSTHPTVCYKECLCGNGTCDIDGKCTCNSDYTLFNGSCIVLSNCYDCNSTCADNGCHCEDGKPCESVEQPAEAASATRLAGLQMTWILGGCAGIILVAVVIIVIGYIGKRQREYGVKPGSGNIYDSVAYTVPNTLIKNGFKDNYDEQYQDEDIEDHVKDPSRSLLTIKADDNDDEVQRINGYTKK